MEIERRDGEANLAFVIQGIEGDMGEETRLDLLQQADGDVVLVVRDSETECRHAIEFCSSAGGGRHPVIATKLRELVAALVEQEG
tara:strand:- start:7295 stop:7549 length:255 start_codon:yes stop_codon:yes gene_type:complete